VANGRERELRIERDSVSNGATKDYNKRLKELYKNSGPLVQTEVLEGMTSKHGCVRAICTSFLRKEHGRV
jgi:hypothetical protein